MAYLTQELVQARVGGDRVYRELTDDDGSLQGDPTVAKLVLEQVDALLNGYILRGGYTAPLTDPDDIQSVLLPLLDVANYKLRTRGNREASEDDRLQYQNAIKIFESIAAGDFVFPSGGGVSETEEEFEIDSYPQLFNRDELDVL